MHTDYLFPIGNQNAFSSQHCTNFILPSEFRVSIHNGRNQPILDNYDNYFLLRGAVLSHCTKNEEILNGKLHFLSDCICSYHVTHAFQSESKLYSCLNVKELLAQNRRDI